MLGPKKIKKKIKRIHRLGRDTKKHTPKFKNPSAAVVDQEKLTISFFDEEIYFKALQELQKHSDIILFSE